MNGISKQTSDAVEKNADFFAGEKYSEHVATLDSHETIRRKITEEVAGTRRLLDIGNGGVFEYDTSVVEEIVAVDLFLDRLPPDSFPANVAARVGDALDLQEQPNHFDAALQAYLFHHLVGDRAGDVARNTELAIEGAVRSLKPGGKLVVAESCVPRWFYGVEHILYKPLTLVAKTPLLGGHPATLQLPVALLVEILERHIDVDRIERIPLGRWITQFGFKWPTALTPVGSYLIVGHKRAIG
jgi:SAM-dependent methyltransferase